MDTKGRPIYTSVADTYTWLAFLARSAQPVLEVLLRARSASRARRGSFWLSAGVSLHDQ